MDFRFSGNKRFTMCARRGTDLEFPNNCYLIGDKIYPNRGNVAQQLARKQWMENL